jgi:hypothetical protein
VPIIFDLIILYTVIEINAQQKLAPKASSSRENMSASIEPSSTVLFCFAVDGRKRKCRLNEE